MANSSALIQKEIGKTTGTENGTATQDAAQEGSHQVIIGLG